MFEKTEKKVICYQCKKELQLIVGDKVGRRDECVFCTASLHCCKMCRFYDNSAYNQCREPNAERFLDKDKTNFCSYFELFGPDANAENADSVLSAANALFKD